MNSHFDYYYLRREGLTYAEIARRFNVCPQTVHRAIRDHHPELLKIPLIPRCKYKNLLRWMIDHEVDRAKLCRMVYRPDDEKGQIVITKWLQGVQDPTKTDIDLLIKATGLEYDELFEEEL